jgi:hypothetical protein
MNQFLSRVLKRLRGDQQERAKDLRARTDSIRKKVTAARGAWNGTDILRAIRDGR